MGLLYLKVGVLIAEYNGGEDISYRRQCGWDLGSFLFSMKRHEKWKRGKLMVLPFSSVSLERVYSEGQEECVRDERRRSLELTL